MKRDSVTAVSPGNEAVAAGQRNTAPAATSHAEAIAAGHTIREGDVLGGKYQVERVLRAGGMGLVLIATHLQLQEKVALKVLVGRAAGETTAVTRFLREARAATRVKSEHVVRILDFGTLEEGEPYLVMELLAGRDLRDILREQGPLPVGMAIQYMLQVCRGLSAVHAQRIIHRDLKPANLFVTETSDGAPLVKVLDFGIAKALEPERLALGAAETETLTHAAQLLGSPVYMSPEQIRSSANVDERSDVWSLGVILYELVTGQTPFHAASVPGLLASIAADAPRSLRNVLPTAPPELERVIFECLDKDVSRRISGVDALARRLENVAAQLSAAPATEARPSADDMAARHSSRLRWVALAAAAVAATAGAFWLHRIASPDAPASQPAFVTESNLVAPLPAAAPTPLPSNTDAPELTAAPSTPSSAVARGRQPSRRKIPARTTSDAPSPRTSSPEASANKHETDYETSATERRK